MTKRKFNVFIGIMLAFIVCFLVGTFAYEDYRIQQSDSQYEESLDDLENSENQNAAGSTNQQK